MSASISGSIVSEVVAWNGLQSLKTEPEIEKKKEKASILETVGGMEDSYQ